ncbi:MAG: hypothetical protein ACTSRP_04670 [Candidatus Helarchaeota archaeon]
MTKVKELDVNSKGVSLIVKIIDIGKIKEVISRAGKKLKVADVLIADDTGAIRLNVWNEKIDEIEKGAIIKIENAYTNEFRNELFLNLGKYSKIIKIDPESLESKFDINPTLIHKIDYEIKNSQPTSINFIKIQDLKGNTRNINVKFKVIKKYEPRSVQTKYGNQIICDFLIGDDTGCIILTLWNDDIYEIALNSYYELKGGYISTFRNISKLNKGRFGALLNISKEEAGFSDVNESNNLSNSTN